MNDNAEQATTTGSTLPPLPSTERIQELLFDAARIGRTAMIPPLLRGGAVSRPSTAKAIPRSFLPATMASRTPLRYCWKLGAPFDQPDGARGNTALMGEAFKGYDAIADLLLDAGANPHSVNRAGQTALMMASLFDHYAIVDRLSALGADPRATDVAGNSAISVAND